VCRIFEGLPVADPNAFDDPNLNLEMRNMQKIRLDMKFTRDARRLMISKLFRRPLKLMQDRMYEIMTGYEGEDPTRYMIYSGHDTTVINVVEFLHPENIEANYADFATNVVMELHYDEECVAGPTASEDCFTVQTLWNGVRMGFQECVTRLDSEGIDCTMSQFKDHMHNVWYDGSFADDFEQACNQPTKPYGLSH
jgi:hypothetical protein